MSEQYLASVKLGGYPSETVSNQAGLNKGMTFRLTATHKLPTNFRSSEKPRKTP